MQNRVERAAEASGRKAHEIELLAVTKMRKVHEVQALYDLGLRRFGENRVAEALGKIALFPEEVEWHMIGHLQSNKTDLCTRFHTLQSLDRAKTARALESSLIGGNKTMRVLIEVNTGGEGQKDGTSTEAQLNEVIEAVLSCPHLSWQGLMTMAPFTRDEVVVRRCFSRLYHLRESLSARFSGQALPVLSMGMSNDFEWAIAEGSTMLRIGTLLFESTP